MFVLVMICMLLRHALVISVGAIACMSCLRMVVHMGLFLCLALGYAIIGHVRGLRRPPLDLVRCKLFQVRNAGFEPLDALFLTPTRCSVVRLVNARVARAASGNCRAKGLVLRRLAGGEVRSLMVF